MPSRDRTTVLLEGLREGDRAALDQLWPRVYDDVRAIARARLRRHRPGDTLNTTAVVHEAYLRLSADAAPAVENRAHFFALAARAVRFVLVDYARERMAEKRGGGVPDLPLDERLVGTPDAEADAARLLTLDAALDGLAHRDARLAEVVELRFFGGMEHAEVAEATGRSVATVKRDWQRARAWLYRLMQDESLREPPARDSPNEE